MDINEIIEGWKNIHFSLLDEFNKTSGMMTEREICECVDHRRHISKFVEDLRKINDCYMPNKIANYSERDRLIKLEGLAKLMMQYLKESDNEGDFFDWADSKDINSDNLQDTFDSLITSQSYTRP